MTADPDDPTSAGSDGSGVGEADRVLLLALRTWAPTRRASTGSTETPEADPRERLLGRLGPEWANRLRDVHEGTSERAKARERLRDAHRAEARVDLSRVHPTWWARALREESPAVQRALVASSPLPIRRRLQAELLLDDADVRPDRPPDPTALAWASSLWTERLVGGEPRKDDDPPVIVAMSSLSPRAAYRLCRDAGTLKLAMAGQPRRAWADAMASTSGPEFAVIARHDLRATSTAASRLPSRRLPARIGLLTIARLLAACEPFRVRWALQHWPYAIAKIVRSLMPPAEKRTPVMMQVEATILARAIARIDPTARSRAANDPIT